MKNPFALVILSAKKIILLGKDLGEKSTFKFNIMKRMLRSGYSREKIIHMLEFIERAVQLPEELDEEIEIKLRNDKEIGIMAEEYIMGSFTRRHYNKGLLEGKLEGRLEGELEGEHRGKLEVAENLLKEKLPEELVEKVSGLEKSEILKLKKKLSASGGCLVNARKKKSTEKAS